MGTLEFEKRGKQSDIMTQREWDRRPDVKSTLFSHFKWKKLISDCLSVSQAWLAGKRGVALIPRAA